VVEIAHSQQKVETFWMLNPSVIHIWKNWQKL